MAKVEYGSIITDMIGSIGGLTFQHNGSGKIVRLRPSRRKTSSLKQQARVTAFSEVVYLWSSISPAVRATWNNFGAAHSFLDKWGNSKTLNGYQWFLSVNNYLAIIQASLITSPPSYDTPLAVQEFTVGFAYNEVSYEFDPTFSHEGYVLLVYTSPPMRSQKLSLRPPLRLTYVDGGISSGLKVINSYWEETHGLSLPLSGATANTSILMAIQSIGDASGISSAFTFDSVSYTPS